MGGTTPCVEMSRDTPAQRKRVLWWFIAVGIVAAICVALIRHRTPERAHTEVRPVGPSRSVPALSRPLAAHPRVAGTVRESDGQPISDATVVLVAGDDSAPAAVLERTRSDARGAFELDPGGHQLVTIAAAADHFIPVWREVEVATGPNRVEVTLVLKRGGFTISGRVLDAAGGLVGGALVFRRPSGFDGDERGMAASVATDDGRYRITLAGGDHVLVFRRDGYADKTLEVRVDRDQEIDVHLSPGSRIVGKVVQGPSDAPVEGAVVTLRALRTNEHLQQAKTDAHGRFVLSGLAPAVYELSAQHGAGFVACLENPRLLRPLSTEEVVLRLSEGGTVSGQIKGTSGLPIGGARIGLARVEQVTSRAEMVGAAGPDGRYTLRGVLPEHSSIVVQGPGLSWDSRRISVRPGDVITGFDFTLAPVVDVDVRVVAAGDPVIGVRVRAIVGDRRGEEVTTGANGTARLPGVPEGKVLLTASHDQAGEARATVVVGTRRTFELALENSATIRVRGLVRWENGATAAGVPVYIFCFGLGFAQTRTDATGQYEFRGCEPGMLSVEASHREQSLDVWRRAHGNTPRDELERGEEVRTADLRVREGGAIFSGHVVSPDGSPVTDATVTLRAALERRTAMTDPSGQFEIRDVARGAYEVNVVALGYPKVWLKTVVSSRQDLRIELKQGATLRGRVVDRAGKPGAFRRVLASSAAGYNDETHTGVNGAFVITGLLPGTYRILVRDAQRGDVAVASARLAAGDDHVVQVVAPDSTVGEPQHP